MSIVKVIESETMFLFYLSLIYFNSSINLITVNHLSFQTPADNILIFSSA